MLVLPEKRLLVVNTDVRSEVHAAIPHARVLEHNGEELLAVPFGVDESIVLRNMGFSTPAPIRSYYSWPARFAPMEHQMETAAFLTTRKRALCLNAPGTGKTISALWGADFLLTEGAIRKVLIVAPLSTLKVVWARELRHHLPHRSFVICVGDRAKRLELLETPGVQYVIINHDGFTNISPHLSGFDLVIYDEATALKTPGSQRYKVFSKWVSTYMPWLWLLTGTPISQTPADAWTLARLMDSPSCPRSYTTFKDRVMHKITQYKWAPRPDALSTVRSVLQPSIRFSLDECKDIPETLYVGRKCSLSSAQTTAFKDMKNNAVALFSTGQQVTAANAAVVLGKLLQICGGMVYSDSGAVEVGAEDRYQALKALIEEIGDKVVVYCPLRALQDWLYGRMQKDGISVAAVHGDVGRAERDQIFNNFQHTDEPTVLLAHPRVASHGLTLTRARDVIWYLPVYSLEQYEQANARIRRLTTDGKTAAWHIWATPFEAELYRRLRTKQTVLTDFLTMVNGVNED